MDSAADLTSFLIMGASLLITLREGLEISLVLAIIFAYLKKSGRVESFKAVWQGTAAAAAVCIVAGVVFHTVVGDFAGKTEQLVEGVLALSAVAVLTWMIFWMRSHARSMHGRMHSRIDTALAQSPLAVAAVAFIAVAREGFETVLFLVGAEAEGSSGTQVVVGGLIGLGAASLLGFALYTGSYRIDLRKFFNWTGALLILFAAGLFAKGIHELRQFFDIEWSAIATPLWEVASGPWTEGHNWHDFMKGLFGWNPNPERIRVVAYFAYLLPVGWAYYRGAGTTPAGHNGEYASKAHSRG